MKASNGAVDGAVRIWLRAEGLAVLALSILLYWHSGSRWRIFLVLLLTPDLSMVPYLLSPRVGGVCYNIVHSYFLPASIAVLAILLNQLSALPFVCIWTAHIGLDRFLGFGLKYSTFGETHLGILASRPLR